MLIQLIKADKTQRFIEEVNKGANPCITDSDLWSTIHWAVQKDNFSIVKYLITQRKKQFLQLRTGSGFWNGLETPLIIAANNKQMFMTMKLVGYGADLNAMSQKNQRASLIIKRNFDEKFYFDVLYLSKQREQLAQEIQNLKDGYSQDIQKAKQLIRKCSKFLNIDQTQKPVLHIKNNILNFLKSHNFEKELQISKTRVKALQQKLQKIQILQKNKIKRKEKLIEAQKQYEKGIKQYEKGIKKIKFNKEEGITYIKNAQKYFKQAIQLDPTIKIKQQNTFQQIKKYQTQLQNKKKKIIDGDYEEILHHICAILSQDVYNPKIQQFPQIIQKTKYFQCSIQKKSKVHNFNTKCQYNKGAAGLWVKAYQISIRNNKKIIFIAYSGTNINENGDIAANILLTGNMKHYQFELALNFAKKIIQFACQLNIQQVIHTGHSLGAFIAEATAIELSHTAITFQSPGSYQLVKSKNILHHNVITYLTAPNFINTLKPHIGKSYRLNIKTQLIPEGKWDPTRGIINYLIPNLIKQLFKPVQKTFKKDIQNHGINQIVKDFPKLYKTRRQIIQWPIGMMQYFALATLLIQTKKNDPDDLVEDKKLKDLSIFYKLKQEKLKQEKLKQEKILAPQPQPKPRL